MNELGAFAEDVRGVSQTVAYVLLIAMVFTSTGVVVVVGAQSIADFQAENQYESASILLQETDSRLASLSASDESPTTTLDLGESTSQHVAVDRSGSLNITINGDPSCSTEIPLGSIRFENEGRIVAYEGGGVWERSPGGGSTMIEAPSVAYREGTLEFDVVNVSGQVDQGVNEARLNVSSSEDASRAAEAGLKNCRRFETVNVTVQSSFHAAWGQYLAEQTGGTLYENADTTDPQTVRVELDSDDLPERVDYRNNSVINMSNPSYMHDVTFTGDSVSVDKDADNTYIVSVTSLRNKPPEVGRIRPLAAENITNYSRPPIDVVFVIDESGSMAGSKIADARDAGQNAVGTLNTSGVGDRASVVGYTAYSNQRYIGPEERFFSNDSTRVNATIAGLHASGSTDLSNGLNASIAALSARKDHRPAHILLLTDGENSPGSKCYEYGYASTTACQNFFDEKTLAAAEIADSKGYTVHTFGFGSGADETLLRQVNGTTGGEYHYAADGDELSDVFEHVVTNITQDRDYVTRTPLSTNFTAARGETFPPQIVGDTDAIARHSMGGNTFLNINDPTAPTLYSHSFAISDGEEVTLNATTFECAEWRGTGQTEKRGGETYQVARCIDIRSTNRSLPDDRIVVNETGDDASWLMTNDEINASLDRYTNNTNDEFTLESNQVVVTFDFPESPGSENNLVLVYEVGIAESEASSANVINVEVSDVTVG